MSKKIIGVTVGTSMNPEAIRRIFPDTIPAGGTAGQYLRKMSDDDYDVAWADLEIPKEYGLITYDQDRTITIT